LNIYVIPQAKKMKVTRVIYSSQSDSITDYAKKIYEHRSLIYTFAKRDLKIKFAQTHLGLAWAIIQPLTAVLIFTVFFSLIINFKTEYPYVLFVLSGMLIWGIFNYIFSQSSTSLSQSQDLIKKMSFPKIILPISKIILALVEFVLTFILLIILLIIFQMDFHWTMILLPIIILPILFFSLGLALLLSSIALKNRDLFHIVPFLVNFGIWFTPVFYPISIIPAEFKNLIYINPIAASIQLFRWSFFGENFSNYIFIGITISFVVFIIGFISFKNVEDKIIDLL
jgi:lipopolysaccharide transport system permease protein